MIYTLSNHQIEVEIHKKGAQLWSIKDHHNTQYLWQGNPQFWKDRAINLFPYIARLTKGKYLLNGKEYAMGIHGFLRDSELEVIHKTLESITFLLEDNKTTYEQYPYHFKLEISYTLKGATVQIDYKVLNKDDIIMYFGIGGHPGFQVPLNQSLKFEDYYLQFESSVKPTKIGFSDDCFVTGKDTAFALIRENTLPLTHDLFDHDAIILKNMGTSIHLLSKNSNQGVRVSFPDMKYLGIWHKPHTTAPYVCLEPWTSLPSRKDIIEDLATQEDLISLQPKEEYLNSWSITIGELNIDD